MQRFVIVGAVTLILGGAGVSRISDLEGRLERLDEASERAPREVGAVRSELETVRAEMEELEGSLVQLESREDVQAATLQTALDRIEREIAEASTRLQDEIAVQDASIRSLVEFNRTYGPDFFDRRVRAARAEAAERWDSLESRLSSALSIVHETKRRIEEVDGEIARDVDVMWEDLVGPTVQLSGPSTVGSGVLLKSEPSPDGEGYETLMLTAWHVVRDILAESAQDEEIVPVSVYTRSGRVWQESAELLEHDAELDVALMRMRCDRKLPAGASLAPRPRLGRLRTFEEIYAVGCPLGNDPIPTRGEVADPRHRVDGNRYWMISAPTYIGNSGGGVFDARTHQLIGIFTKIYTHGSLRPTVVPHMGLATPLSLVYDWLEGEGYARVAPAEDGKGSVAIARVRR